jgi:hypothetical protein
VKRVGRWILAQLAKTRRSRAPGSGREVTEAAWIRQASLPFRIPGTLPEEGLMPPGVLADWNAFAYHFCLNAYYVAALRELGTLLETVGDRDAGSFRSAAEALQRDTAASYHLTRAASPAVPLRNGTWVPYYPSQVHSPGKLADFFPGEDAGRSWCYDVELGAHQLVPTGVFPPDDEAVTSLLEHTEDVQFLADGWFDYPAVENARDRFNLGGFSKVQPYYCRQAEIYALRNEVKPFLRSYFNSLASLVNPEVMTFWEHFRHSGAWDKTHETGYFLHQTRLLLVQERGLELWLAPMIPRLWLADGKRLSVRNAPTRFGPVSFHLESHVARSRIEAEVQPPTDRPLLRVVLRVPPPGDQVIRQVTVNGERHEDFDAERQLLRLTPNRGPLRISLQLGPPAG